MLFRSATRLVYARLSSLVGDITFGGFAVIVDAAFLGYPVRESFRELARGLGLPLWIVSCQSSAATCRRRVKRREAAMNDASEAGVSVFENQRLTSEPLSAGELTHTLIIDTECDPATLRSRIDELAVRARKGPPSAVQPEARRASRGSQ